MFNVNLASLDAFGVHFPGNKIKVLMCANLGSKVSKFIMGNYGGLCKILLNFIHLLFCLFPIPW